MNKIIKINLSCISVQSEFLNFFDFKCRIVTPEEELRWRLDIEVCLSSPRIDTISLSATYVYSKIRECDNKKY